MNKARNLALQVLARLEQETAFLPELLQESAQGAGEGDTARATALVYGFLRSNYKSLLKNFVPRPEKLPSKLWLLLRLAAWELVYGHEPEHAVLHQWVQGAKAAFGPKMAGLCNAVLRNVQRHKAQLAAAEIDFLNELPLWIASLWEKDYGHEQARAFATQASEEPCPCYRVNRQKNGWQTLREAMGGLPFGASGVANAADVPQWKLAHTQGLLSRQGAASQLLVQTLVEHDFCGPVWDACCGRGGKSVALMEAGCKVLWASDLHKGRLQQFQSDLARLGLPGPALFSCPAQHVPLCDIPFILLDAPCSGLGTLARNPELRLRLTPAMAAQSAVVQAQLLAALWPKLATGGLLAYVTCSLNLAENEGQISAFLAAQGNASLLYQALLHPPRVFSGQDYLFLALLRKKVPE